MLKKSRVAATAAAMLGLCVLASAAQTGQEATVFTYVAEYRFKPGKAADFWEYFEKAAQPVLDQLVADGTLQEWGRSSSVVHTVDGMTDSFWLCAKSVGATQKAIEKLMGPRPANVVDAIEKHSDRLLESIIFRVGSKRVATGYLETHSYVVKPGRGQDWLDLFKRYQQPVYERLLASGVILGYGIDREAIHTGPSGYRGIWVLLADAEALDKEGEAWDAESAKQSPEDGRLRQGAIADMTLSDQHRDGLDRVSRWVRK